MDNSTNYYECKYHKIELTGQKRRDFSSTFYEVLLWVPMQFSMRLYKEVKVGCDCPENYKAFDTIVKEAIEYLSASISNPNQETEITSPKDTELDIQ
jgi:hypothetical protein